ncbi:MAG: DHHA1 domain-containing protein, partial [Candidatus Altiarchaeota archaeon]
MRLYQGGAVPGVELRIVNIVGVDVEACGGTHLTNTSEAGHIKMLSAKRIQDGVVRLEFTAGGASDRRSGREEELFAEAARMLGVDDIFDTKKLRDAATIFKVQSEKLPQTIGRFRGEYEADSATISSMKAKPYELKKSKHFVEAAENLFEAWKQSRKVIEKLQSATSWGLADEIDVEFQKGEVVKHLTSDLNVKTLTEIASKAVGREGRLLVLVNKEGEKVNVVVASNSKHNAGEVCKRLCETLGGGGGGNARLAMGGGNAKGVEGILERFNP